MTNGKHTAFPATEEHTSGLNKREYFAAMAMQGLLANHGAGYADDNEVAALSVVHADALINELNKTA